MDQTNGASRDAIRIGCYRPCPMALFFRLRGTRILKRFISAGFLVVSVGVAQVSDESSSPSEDGEPTAAVPADSAIEVDEAQALAVKADDAGRKDAAREAEVATRGDASAQADDVARKDDAAQKEALAKKRAETALPPRKDILHLRQLAAHIDALLREELSVDIEPATLFQIDLADPKAASLEARWLASLLDPYQTESRQEQAKDEAEEQTENSPEQAPLPPVESPESAEVPSGEAPSAIDTLPFPEDGTNERHEGAAEYESLRKSDPELWRARLALDQARLRFFALPSAKRTALLGRHAERQHENARDDPDQQIMSAERKGAEADAERLRALETARVARSEAARLVAEERARLLGVAKRQAEFEAELVGRRGKLKAAQDESLALQRRVREVLQAARGGEPNLPVDARYDQVRAVLKVTRSALRHSLGQHTNNKSEVPSPGENRLDGILQEVDQTQARKTRAHVEKTAQTLARLEQELWADVADQSFTHMEALGALRLELVPWLSDEKRTDILGLGPAGLDQALSEARQVVLVLRHHHNATTRWLHAVTKPTATRGRSALTATLIALKWILPVFAFIWWRRTAKKLLPQVEQRIRQQLEEGHLHSHDSHPALRAIQFLEHIRNPLEWLLLAWAFVWFLPGGAQGLLEVELVRTIATWTLGGSIAVRTIDFLSADSHPRYRRRSGVLTSHIRLRSLRLVGLAVVAFGLILGLTSQLVGRGTIYSWVFTLLWIVAAAVFLVLVKWWRSVIFERVATKRKKTSLDRWVVDNKTGWKSLVAAVVGGTKLFASGVYKAVRLRVSGFALSRKFLAYLFQRDMSRQAAGVVGDNCQPLSRELYLKLSPMKASDQVVPSIADLQLDQLIARINLHGGGIFAIVGERGGGKTTLLRRIEERAQDVVRVQTPYGDLSDFKPAFLKALVGTQAGSLDEVAAAFDATERNAGILIDNAHRLIRPTVGGFEGLDQVLSMARKHSKNIAWVFAFDEVIWRLLERMRGTTPLFDDVIRIAPWNEEGIVTLLTSRNEAAGIDPNFNQLVGELPEDADHIDFEEALAQTEENYLRLLWHYSSGNPGLALHAWRMSLGMNVEGEVQVRVFQAPNPAALEELPDSSLFVLRTIVQMERSSIEQICRISHLPSSTVQDVVRYGRVKGYIHETEEGIEITWTWFRAVTKLLQRRHLLYSAHD